jgi:WD40 repeat protein
MEKPSKLKKFITPKRLENILKHQEHLEVDKAFSPGQIETLNTEHCKAEMLNFFGDVHTETFSLKVNRDQKQVAVGCSNGEAKVYDIMEGRVSSIGFTSRMAGYPCTAVRWKPKNTTHFLACNCDGTIKWYHTAKDAAYGHYEHPERSYLCCDYQTEEEWAALGTDSNTIEIFDNETMKPVHVCSC